MSFHVITRCPNCSSESPFFSEQIGQAVYCPKCGKSMTVENSNPVQVTSGKEQRIKIFLKLILSFIIISTITLLLAICFVNRERQILETEKRELETQKRVFETEKRIFKVVNQTLSFHKDIKQAKTIEKTKECLASIIQQIRKMNLENCPEDFIDAYNEHKSAWENTYEAIKEIPNKKSNQGSYLEKEINQLQKTLEKVILSARQYNVDI